MGETIVFTCERMEKIRWITGSLVEPNRHVPGLEETRQIVGFLLRLRSCFPVEGRKHLDVHAKLAWLALICPCSADPAVHEDDRSKPSLVFVHVLVVGSIHEVVSVPMSE